MYVSKSKEMELQHWKTMPCSLEFTFKLEKEICFKWTINEFLIDSTFKTNNGKMEYIAVIAMCMQTEFPSTYLKIDPEISGAFCSATESIYHLLSSLVASLVELRSLFSFINNESSQTAAVHNSLQIKPSPSLWHMKRAIHWEIKWYRSEELNSFDSRAESELLILIGSHYFRSSSYINLVSESLYAEAKIKLRAFFEIFFLPTVQKYIEEYWY